MTDLDNAERGRARDYLLGPTAVLTFRDSEGEIWVGAAILGDLKAAHSDRVVSPNDAERMNLRLTDIKVVLP